MTDKFVKLTPKAAHLLNQTKGLYIMIKNPEKYQADGKIIEKALEHYQKLLETEQEQKEEEEQ